MSHPDLTAADMFLASFKAYCEFWAGLEQTAGVWHLTFIDGSRVHFTTPQASAPPEAP